MTALLESPNYIKQSLLADAANTIIQKSDRATRTTGDHNQYGYLYWNLSRLKPIASKINFSIAPMQITLNLDEALQLTTQEELIKLALQELVRSLQHLRFQ